jgi:drug/metabolite transporter (DMT)-like permease
MTPNSIYVYTVICLCTIGLSIGQVLFKLAAKTTVVQHSIFSLLLSPYLIAGFILYGIITLGWSWSLRYIELSKAYPFMALAYILVPLAAAIIFKESISAKYWLGSLFIFIGIILSVSS